MGYRPQYPATTLSSYPCVWTMLGHFLRRCGVYSAAVTSTQCSDDPYLPMQQVPPQHHQNHCWNQEKRWVLFGTHAETRTGSGCSSAPHARIIKRDGCFLALHAETRGTGGWSLSVAEPLRSHQRKGTGTPLALTWEMLEGLWLS